MNIPIYRAKKIDIDEWVEGFYYQVPPLDKNGIGHMICDFVNTISPTQIDKSTLAIHFPNIIDKNGKKIFASLGEDGIGGDKYKTVGDHTYLVYFKNGAVCGGKSHNTCIPLGWEADLDDNDVGNGETRINDVDFVEVIGIHKGE